MRRVRDWARRLKTETLALYLAARDPRTPWYARLLVAGIAAYALSPIDLIPDFIPVLGYLDELVLVPLGIALALWLIPTEVMAEARARARAELDGKGPRSRVAAAVIVGIWVFGLVALAWGGWYAWRVAHVATGFAAKTVCSGVFVSGRTPGAVVAEDIAAYRNPLLAPVTVAVDRVGGVATATMFGLAERQAVHRNGIGCTLVLGTNVEALKAATPQLPPVARAPALDRAPPDARLEQALDEAFAEAGSVPTRRTRAVVIVHRGRIVAERYAPGFGPDMPLPGWSMAKSVVGALTGVLVGRGAWRLDAPAPVPEWRSPGDPRGVITVDQLLRMSSGLEFSERYDDPLSDVNVMLWASGDTGAFAAAKPLAHPPGTHWEYATGTTNILARAMRDPLGAEYAAFPRRALFGPVGMASAVLEFDAAGTFVGSSFMYATARDWARLGLLFLGDGVWNGERILPAGWARAAATPALPGSRFGAHWWLRLKRPEGAAPVALPGDIFHAGGHAGQYVTVVPSRALVIVRLGHSVPGDPWDQEAFVARIIAAVPP
ncbi:MAG TPA: serine hydrolase [Burkholderiales bacterium]|nr:serine hydrolase [Burkholderiales bacterium]